MDTPLTSLRPVACQRVERRLGRLESRDFLAQDRHEVAHDVHDGLLDAEEVGVQVALGYAVPDLPGQPGVELVHRHGFQNGAAVVGGGGFRIHRDVGALRRHRDLVDAFPRPLEVRAARRDDPQLGVFVALHLVARETGGQLGIVERGLVIDALRTPEDRLDRPLVLVHRVQAGNQVIQQERQHQTTEYPEQNVQYGPSFAA
jgi:hypothetical protein